MNTYAEVRQDVIDTLNATSPGGEGPNGEVVGAVTIPFDALSLQEIDEIIKAAALDDIIASWEDWLNRPGEFTNITFEKKSVPDKSIGEHS
jgi:hypothetical protein